MVGRRYGSFRSGDIAESLGVTLLKSIATVSEVPRQEDVGIDAVANLLRADSDGSLYAEDSFTVQFKSSSSKNLCLASHELDWFMNLRVPHFVGRVDRASGSLDLFATHFGRAAVLAGKVDRLEFRYEREPGHDAVLKLGYAHFLREGTAIVWLGEPVIQVSLHDRNLDGAYCAMKSFLWAEQIAMQFSHLGLATGLRWQRDRGIVDVPQLSFFGRRDGLRDLLGFAAPLMIGLTSHGLLMEKDGRDKTLVPLIEALTEAFRKAGVGDASAEFPKYWHEIHKDLLLRHSPREVT